MKIEAVKMMREIREKMSADTKDMTWDEEGLYLTNRITVFSCIANKTLKERAQKRASPTGVVTVP